MLLAAARSLPQTPEQMGSPRPAPPSQQNSNRRNAVRRLVPLGTLRYFVALIFCFGVLLATAPAQTFSVLHNFTGGIDGSNPFAGLTLDAAGHLYGNSGAGGPGNCAYEGQ